jgi:AcrR family transcriptional regulator
MARPRSAQFEPNRDGILRAAAQLFAAQGYPGTSMNDVARACGISKALLYHYVDDKYRLLLEIAEGHVTRLEALVAEVQALRLPPQACLRKLIERFVEEYALARNEHGVLTQDVKFLSPADRQRVLGKERRIVDAFARAVAAARPELEAASLTKPLAMLLFGMMNWMFTWLRPDGPLTHRDMAPIVAELFLGGLGAVAPAPASARTRTSANARPAAGRRTVVS